MIRDYYKEFCSKCKHKDIDEHDSPCKECFDAFFDGWKTLSVNLVSILKGEIKLKKLREICTIPDDVTEKLVDIYNYMAKERSGKIVLQFETGIKFVCEIDETEWKNPPRINLDDVLKGKTDGKEKI